MTKSVIASLHIALALGIVASIAPLARTSAQPPTPGQPGKDVIWLPSPEALVTRMLDMARVDAGDTLIDLGSGDGRLVIAAARRGATAIGVEYDADLVALSTRRAAAEPLRGTTRFIRQDLFATDLSKATVITLFLREDLNARLRPALLALEPGTRVVSNTFSMAEWEPDDVTVVERECQHWCSAMLWIVPANVQGRWRLPGADLVLAQEFQFVSGTLRESGRESRVEGRIRGRDIFLSAAGVEYRGRIANKVIEGTAISGGRTVPWKGTRE